MKKYKCNVCKKVFYHRLDVRLHIREDHWIKDNLAENYQAEELK